MGKINWRFYDHAKDAKAVCLLHLQLEDKVGAKLDLPHLGDRPVIATVVGETNGVITHGLFLEAEVEVQSISANPLSASELQGAVDLLMPVLRHYKLRIVRAFVPTHMLASERPNKKRPLRRILEKFGFTEEQNALQFFKWLVPAEASESMAKEN